MAVAGLYCDYTAHKEQSATNILGAILNQLLEKDGIPNFLRQNFHMEKGKFGGRTLQLSDLVKILKTTIASLPQVFICIDGLDECLPDNRRDLLKSLQDIVQTSPTTRVFLSGRPHVKDEVEGSFTEAIVILLVPTRGDIERYVNVRLDKDTIPSAMSPKLRAEIMREIVENISPM